MTSLAGYLTEADPVRDHVRLLRGHGASYEAIANAAGLGAMTVHSLMNSGGKVTAVTAAALLAVTDSQLEMRRLDAGGTRLRLRALCAMGHSATRCAMAIRVHPQATQRLIKGDATTVSPELAQAVSDLYEQWWDRRPPERTRDERTAAMAARRRAARHDWPTPMGMDDDDLDVPGYEPPCGWRPAIGVGTAEDIYLPAKKARAEEIADKEFAEEEIA